jgi:hypothetical protein
MNILRPITNGSRMIESPGESLPDLIGFSAGEVVNRINLKGCRTRLTHANGTGELVR